MTLEEMLPRTQKRQESFKIMIEHLKSVNEPLIIETGCARPPHPVWGNDDVSFKDEGWSTRLFDAYINQYGGEFHSVDLSLEHVQFSQSLVSEKSNIHCDDSVHFLWEANALLTKENYFIDLLYLDSYDYEEATPYLSPAHHLKELAAIMSRLKEGSMIAVDDNFGFKGNRKGKGMFIEQFMESIGKPLVYDGYQLIWKW